MGAMKRLIGGAQTRAIGRGTIRAFIFPGQGSQSVGMGKGLADASPHARAVFEEVDDDALLERFGY